MAPWILAILYDILYYICRRIWHEVPIWGGRARGERRPRAPSFRDRTRRMSFANIVSGGSVPSTLASNNRDQNRDREEQNTGTSRRRQDTGAISSRRSHMSHHKTLSEESIQEEKEEE
ncbi:uncharacterized protein Z518_06562 [Rhinocladiella mackenziei CBS 650.93]|uniref:Uncharacterized protein n=1 Tax=Rhinocladiella mackenziei CBS 650.93 TaxID=1442369 RepID=A0A0D2FM47_9EURO|nr:uncharacterized protein Z518_06562 [Rhinocladiella mackenziei CBS 650.93]KIX03012.1 hypothetical protein Z518_06562 [Rhinocladiella mackenziei CBS 650.93]